MRPLLNGDAEWPSILRLKRSLRAPRWRSLLMPVVIGAPAAPPSLLSEILGHRANQPRRRLCSRYAVRRCPCGLTGGRRPRPHVVDRCASRLVDPEAAATWAVRSSSAPASLSPTPSTGISSTRLSAYASLVRWSRQGPSHFAASSMYSEIRGWTRQKASAWIQTGASGCTDPPSLIARFEPRWSCRPACPDRSLRRAMSPPPAAAHGASSHRTDSSPASGWVWLAVPAANGCGGHRAGEMGYHAARAGLVVALLPGAAHAADDAHNLDERLMKSPDRRFEMARPTLAVLFLCLLIAASLWILSPSCRR
jgi:hypothetical protein